jgi:hypothetical protein
VWFGHTTGKKSVFSIFWVRSWAICTCRWTKSLPDRSYCISTSNLWEFFWGKPQKTVDKTGNIVFLNGS